MAETDLNEIEIQKKATEIVVGLNGLSSLDAVCVLNKAVTLATENLAASCLTLTSTFPQNPNLKRRRRRSKIKSDPEIKDFIHSLGTYHTISEITVLCEKQFGKERAPSSSAVGRYLQEITKR